MLVAALLTALLGARLGTLTWTALPQAEPVAPAPPSRVSPQATGSNEEAPTIRLARLQLFGQAPLDEPAEDALADAPETRLNLTLRGLFVAGDGNGMAIIAAGGGDEETYSVGDTVVGNAAIAAILRDRVVVERDGVREVLLMEGVSAPTANRPRAQRDSRRKVDSARRLRQKFRSDPSALARSVRFQPARENGELVGYRIRSRTNELSLETFGVQSSDIVTRVNGVPLDDPRRANEALLSMRDAQTIQLEVLRNGQRRSVSIPIGAPSDQRASGRRGRG
ncbi:MAG: type II secretion system protein GspC [Halofilum sp. (in: g-proteobacteria)]